MDKLSTEQLLEIYKDAIKFEVCKEFIMLLSEEINNRYLSQEFLKK